MRLLQISSAIRAVGFAVILFGAPCAARADVKVRLEGDLAIVEVRDAQVAEVFAALGRAFGLDIRSTPIVQVVNGSYRGSVQQIVSRILMSRDHVTRYAPGLVEVMIYRAADRPAPTAITVVMPNPAAQPAPARPGTRTSVARQPTIARAKAPFTAARH